MLPRWFCYRSDPSRPRPLLQSTRRHGVRLRNRARSDKESANTFCPGQRGMSRRAIGSSQREIGWRGDDMLCCEALEERTKALQKKAILRAIVRDTFGFRWREKSVLRAGVGKNWSPTHCLLPLKVTASTLW